MQRVSSQRTIKPRMARQYTLFLILIYNVYAHPDVYELYLSELLNKGLIEQGEISTAKEQFPLQSTI